MTVATGLDTFSSPKLMLLVFASTSAILLMDCTIRERVFASITRAVASLLFAMVLIM